MENFLKKDPYQINGLITTSNIEEYTQTSTNEFENF